MKKLSFHQIHIYKTILKNIVKNKTFIILIILIEIIQIIFDSIRISRLLLDNDYKETENSFNYYLKYVSISSLAREFFLTNSTQQIVKNNELEIFKYKEYSVSLLILSFLLILFSILTFNLIILWETNKIGNEEYILTNEIIFNNNTNIKNNNTDSIITFILSNIFELIFHVFGSALLEIFLTSFISSFVFILYYNIYNIKILNIMLSTIGLCIYIIFYLYYVRNINIIINFQENFQIHYDKYFSTIYDLFLLYLKLFLGAEQGLIDISIDNIFHLKFMRALYSISIFFFMFMLFFRAIKGELIFIVNEAYNTLRIYLMSFLNFLLIFQFGFAFFFEFDFISCLNLILIVFFSSLGTYFIKSKNFLTLIENNNNLIYQLGYILDKYSLNELEEMNKFIFNLIMHHRNKCEDSNCNIRNLESMKIENIFEAINSEIRKSKPEKSQIKEFTDFTNLKDLLENKSEFFEAKYLTDKSSDINGIKNDDNLEILINMIYFFSQSQKEKKMKNKDYEKFSNMCDLDFQQDNLTNKNSKKGIKNTINNKNLLKITSLDIDDEEENYSNSKYELNSTPIRENSFKYNRGGNLQKQVTLLRSQKNKEKDKKNSSKEVSYRSTLKKLFRYKRASLINRALKEANLDRKNQLDDSEQFRLKHDSFNETNNLNLKIHGSFKNIKTKTTQFDSWKENKEAKKSVKYISNTIRKESIKYFSQRENQKTLLRHNNPTRENKVSYEKITKDSSTLLVNTQNDKNVSLLQNQNPKVNKRSIIKLMFNTYKFLNKKSKKQNLESNIMNTINIILNEHFVDNHGQFINYKLIIYYIEILNDIYNACDLLNNIIQLFNNKNYSGIFEMSTKLCSLDSKIEKNYRLISLTKNKNYFSDIYSLYIIKYLFEETFNKELQSNNNIIFSSDMNKQLVEKFNSDNFIIIKSAEKNFNKNNKYDSKGKYYFNNQKQKHGKNQDYSNDTFSIIKATKFFVQHLNKNIEIMFPHNLKDEIGEHFVYSVYESDGNSFNFKTVLEFTFGSINQDNQEIIVGNDGIIIFNKEMDEDLEMNISVNNELNFNNQSYSSISVNEYFLKTAKLNCRIFPSFNVQDVLIYVDIFFYDEETIIFEEELESLNKIEHINNISTLLSNSLYLPLELIKVNKKNTIAFEKIFKSKTRKKKETENSEFLNIIKENKNVIVNKYNSFFKDVDMAERYNFFGNEIENPNVFSNGNIGNFISYEFYFTRYLPVLKSFIQEMKTKFSNEDKISRLYKQATINENKRMNLEIAAFEFLNIGTSLYKIYQVKFPANKKAKRRGSTTNFVPIMDYFRDNCSVEMSINNSASLGEKADIKFNIYDSQKKKNADDKRYESRKIKKYLFMILLIIAIFIIAEIVLFIFGWNNMKLLNEILNINKNYNIFSTHFYNTYLSIFINTKVNLEKSSYQESSNIKSDEYFSKYYQMGIDSNVFNFREFFKKEFIVKLDIYKTNSQNFHNIVFLSTYNSLRDKILNVKIKMIYISNTKRNLNQINENEELFIDQRIMQDNNSIHYNANSSTTTNNIINVGENQVSFFDMVDIFLSLYKIMVDKTSNETFNFYLMDNHDDKINFDFFNKKKLSSNEAAFYQLILNYENFYKNFEFIRNLLQTEIYSFFEFVRKMTIYNAFIFMGLHVLLIFILLITLGLFNEIIRDNIHLMEDMLYKEKKEFLQNQFRELKQLSLLYAQNPYTIMKSLKKEKQKLSESNSSKVRLINGNKIGFTTGNVNNQLIPSQTNSIKNEPDISKEKVNVNKNKQTRLDSKLSSNKFAKLLIIIFFIYYLYSISMYFLYINFESNLLDSVKISILGPDLYQSSLNNVILLTLSSVLNQTDIKLSKFFQADPHNIQININKLDSLDHISINQEELYLQEKIKSIYNKIEEFKKILITNRMNDLINTYYFDYIDCQLIYLNYGDSIISQFSNDTISKYSGNNTYENSLVKFCQSFPFMNIHSLYAIYEEIAYRSRLLYSKLDESDREYHSLMSIYQSPIFKDLYSIISLILRPIREYINKNLNAFIIQNNIDSYFYFILIYLSLNCFVDVIILFMTYRNVIRNVNDINNNFEIIMNCLKH